MKSIIKLLWFSYRFLKYSLIFLIGLLVLLWLLYPSIQPLVLKYLDLSDNIHIVVSNVSLDYVDKKISIQVPRVEIKDKVSNNLIGLIQDVKIGFISENFNQPNKGFVDISASRLFLDLDKIQRIQWPDNNQNWTQYIRLIKRINLQTILVKFGQKLLPTIAISYQENKFSISSFEYTPSFPTLFVKDLPPTTVSGTVDLDINQPNIFNISAVLKNKDMHLNIFYAKNKDKDQLLVKSPKVALAKIQAYIPYKILSLPLSNWLKNAFSQGVSYNNRFELTRYTQLPPLIKFSADFAKASLKFHPDWPELTNATGRLTGTDQHINIYAQDVILSNLQIQSASVSITGLTQATPVLTSIITTKSNPIVKVFDFLDIKPLKGQVPNLDWMQVSGNSTGVVELSILLDQTISPAIKVTANTSSATLEIPEYHTRIEQLKIDFLLDEASLTITGSGVEQKQAVLFLVNDYQDNFSINVKKDKTNFQAKTNYQDDLQDSLWHIKAKNGKSSIVADVLQDSANNQYQVNIKQATLASASRSFLHSLLEPTDIPKITLHANSIKVADYWLPELDLILVPSKDKVILTGSAKTNAQLNIDVSGTWDKQKTTIDLQAQHKNLSVLLDLFKVKDRAKAGDFNANVSISCACNPWQVSLKKLQGKAEISIKKGILERQDASFSRLLALLNITALGRRLSLDTSDALDKGFSYNGISSKVNLDLGKLKIENFNLLSLANDITMVGEIDLLEQQLNLTATVIPALSDALPLTSLLAGGGLAGLGLWLVDKVAFKGQVMDSLLNKNAAFDYKITGDLQNPVIK